MDVLEILVIDQDGFKETLIKTDIIKDLVNTIVDTVDNLEMPDALGH